MRIRATKSFEQREKEHAYELIDALISWTNADDEDAITLGREDCCYLRNEIERLREIEKKYLSVLGKL